MRSKSKFIKQYFFILFFISFVSSKNYARKCTDVSSNGNQKLAIQALAGQLYLNNLVIRLDESANEARHAIQEINNLTDTIEAGLVDLSKDVQQAIKTERSLIQTASGILEYQYSLNEQAASVVDFLLSAPVKQKQIPLDLEFLDKKIFKEGFNTAPEFYSDQIDELLGYVPGDPYATKAFFLVNQPWTTGAAYSTSWHPTGDYVAITGDYNVPNAIPHLTIYDFDGTSLSDPVNPTGTPGGMGQYRSIKWSPDGGYLLAGGDRNSVDFNRIRVFVFTEGPKAVTQLTAAPYDTGFLSDVMSVAWHPDWNATTGGFCAAVGNGAGKIQVYKIDLLGPSILDPVCDATWGGGYVYDCSWSSDGKYLAVAGLRNNQNKVLRVFEFISTLGSEDLIESAFMLYNSFDFYVDWISGVDWAGKYLALSANSFLPQIAEGGAPQIAMYASGDAIVVWKYIHPSGNGVIKAQRYDAGTGLWQAVETLTPVYNDCSEPQIAVSDNYGTAMAVWQKSDGGGNFTIQASLYDPGVWNWVTVNISPSGQRAEHSQISMNRWGDAIAVWQRPDNITNKTVIQANIYSPPTPWGWQSPSVVTDFSDVNKVSEKPQVAFNDYEIAVVVWRQYDGANYYTIKARQYDNLTSILSDIVAVSFSRPYVDSPQVALNRENYDAIIVWQGRPYFSPPDVVQARRFNGGTWDLPIQWEPLLGTAATNLSETSKPSQTPQIAMDEDGNGIAVWKRETSSRFFIMQARRYILGPGWDSVKDLSTSGPPGLDGYNAGDPQIAMDRANPGNAIVVWRGFSNANRKTTIQVNRYDAVANAWQAPTATITLSPLNQNVDKPQIAMDSAGNAIAVWVEAFFESPDWRYTVYASRYYVATDSWNINLGKNLGRYSLKIVEFNDVSPEELTFVTAWNETQLLNNGVMTAKWSPSEEAVAIGLEPININGIKYNILVFKLDPLTTTLTQVEGSSIPLSVNFQSHDLAWRPDGAYMAAADLTTGALQIYDLDFEYFVVVKETYDTSIPTNSIVDEVNETGLDVSSWTELLCQKQEKDCTKGMLVKFAIPDGYTGAADFVDIINPACTSADYGLTAVLDASIEVTDSLLGARKRNYKFMQDNLKLSKRLTDVYKKSIEIKKIEQARVIDQPGVYTFNKDVQGVIVIDADNITLDLNGHKIFSDSKIPITVNKNIKNISIKNGSIIGGNQYLGALSGILVKEGAQHITLENLTITFCYEGVTFKGEQDCSVTDCLVQDCAFKSNIKAASLDCSEYVTFKECEFLDCFLDTVNLENNNKNCCQ